jgi:8-oxo-dGTP diphosphatase
MPRFTLIASGYVLIIREGKILLMRRYNTGFEDGKYALPSGHLEPHETIRACAIREAKEEIGITIQPKDIELAHVMHRKNEDERIDYFFAVHAWEGEIMNAEPDKCDDLQWFPLDALPTNIIPYVKTAIRHIQNKQIYSEFGWEM